MGFLGSTVVKNPPAITGDIGLIPGLEEQDPWGRKWQPTPVFFFFFFSFIYLFFYYYFF